MRRPRLNKIKPDSENASNLNDLASDLKTNPKLMEVLCFEFLSRNLIYTLTITRRIT